MTYLEEIMTYLIIIVLFIFAVIMAIPFILEWRRIHGIKGEWESNDVQKAKNIMLEDISRAKKRILIYGGNGDIYNDSEISKALINASEKGVEVGMILENATLPFVGISDEVFKVNKIFLGVTDRKLFKHHFRVVDHDYVYIEKPHPEGTPNKIFKRLPNTTFLPGDFSKTFYGLTEQARTA